MNAPRSAYPTRVPSLFDIFRGKIADGCRHMAWWRKRGLLSKQKVEQTRRRRAVRLEALEPRLLLSADLVAAAGELADGIQGVGQQIQDFIDTNEALNFPLPIVVRPADAFGSEPVTTTVAATLKDLLSVDVQRDDNPALTPFETALDSLDADNDGKVELEEWLGFAFLDKIEQKLRTASTASAASFATEVADFVDTLDAGLSGAGFSLDIDATGTATNDAIVFNVVLDLDFATSLPLDLGTEMEEFGISFPDLSIAIALGLELDITFGVFIQGNVGANDFFVDDATLTAEASASTNLNGASIDIGFIGASVQPLMSGNHIQFTASIEVAAQDPSSATKLGFTSTQFDTAPQAFILANSLPTGSGTAEFYLQAGRGDTVLIRVTSFDEATINAALATAGFVDGADATVEATRDLLSTDLGRLRLSISADESDELGFVGDTFSSANVLTATNAVAIDGGMVEFLLSVGGALPLFVRATGTDLASIVSSLNASAAVNPRGLAGTGVEASTNVAGTRLILTGPAGKSLEIVKGISIDSKISSVDLATPAALIGAVDTDADLDINIPIAIKAGVTLPDFGLPRISLSNFDPFELISVPDFDLGLDGLGNLKFPLDLQFNTDFLDNLLDFNNISVSSFMGLLGQLSEWLVNLSDIDFLNIEIPLTGVSFGEIIDFVDTLRDALLYDDFDDGVDGDDKLIADINRALDDAGLGGKIYARPVDGKIQLVGDAAFEVSGTAASLGFATAMLADRQSDADSTKHSLLASSVVAPTASSTFTILFRGTTYTVTVDGAGNTGLGNDTQKLLDAGNTPTFGNAQELAEDFAFLLELDPSIIGARYVNQELLFDLRLSDVFAPETIPLDFDLADLGIDLGPLLDISTESSLQFAADGSLSLTLGVSLRPSGLSELLSNSTPLATLNDGDGAGIKEELAVTAPMAPTQIVGRLTENASFQLRVGAEGPVTVNLSAMSTSTNSSIGHLVTDLQNAINATALNGDVTVGSMGNRITLSSTANVTLFEVIADTTNPTVTQLGLQPQKVERAVAEQIRVVAAKDAPKLVGRLSDNATFNVQVGMGAQVAVTVLAADTASNVTILDLVDDMKAALAGQIAGGSVSTFVLTDDATFTATLDSDNNDLDGPVSVTVHAADARILGFVQNQEGRGTLVATHPAPASGALAADMTFLLAVDDDDPVKFTIDKDLTAGFTRAQLVDLINTRLDAHAATAAVTFAYDDVAGKFKFTAPGSAELKILSAGTTQGNADLAALATDVNNALQNALQAALTEHFADDDGLVPPLLEARASGSSIVFTTVNPVQDFNGDGDIDDDDVNPNAISSFQVVAAAGNPADSVLKIPTTAASATNLVGDFVVSAAGDKLVITAEDSITAFTVDPLNAQAETGLGLGTASLAGNEYDLVIEVQNNAFGTNGRFFISLDGATTIGQVISKIETQTASKVDASINEDGTKLVLRDTSVTSAFNGDFHVEATNGSAAALRLGILRADTSNPSQAPDGVIEGATLAGLTLAERFFIENAVASGSFAVSTPGGINASASFGFVGVTLSGNGSLFGAAEIGLKAADDAAAGGRITLKDMADAVEDGEVDNLIATPVITGGGDLNLAVSANVAGIDFGSGMGADAPSLAIQLDRIGNPFVAVFGSNPVANGVIPSGTASFDLAVGDQTAHVNLAASETTGNTTLDELAADLQSAIATALASTTIAPNAFRVDATGNRLFITAVGGATTFQIQNANPTAQSELGLYNGTGNKLPKLDVETRGDFGSLVDFGDIDFGDILAALQALSSFLNQFEAFGFLSEPIPLINVSVNDILSFADGFAATVEELQNNPAGTLQLLEAKLHEALGISPDDVDAISLSIAEGNILKLELGYDTAFTTSLPINFDLGVDLPFDLAGAGAIQADGRLDISLDFGIDLDDPLDPDSIVVYGTTGVFGELDIGSNNLAFRAALGPAGIFIAGGEVRLGGTLASAGGSAANEIFRLSLDVDDAGTAEVEAYKPIADVVDSLGAHIDAQVGASVHVNLPVFFPTESNERGAVTFDAALSFDPGDGGFQVTGGDLGAVNPDLEPIALTELFTFDFANASLLDNILLAIDGIDLFLAGLQDVLDGEVFGVPIPLIGDKLSSAADFIAEFREDFVGTFREEIERLTSPEDNIISRELFKLLGPEGLGILLEYDPGEDADDIVEVEDVFLDTNIDEEGLPFSQNYIQWNVRIGGPIVNGAAGIGFDLGIPGLGLETEGSIDMQMDWELEFGFGLSGSDAFYIDISDDSELQLDIEVTLPDAALTGRLAFLQLRAEDAGTRLGLGFAIDIHNRHDPDDERLALQELGSIGLGVLVAADAEVHLDLTLGLNADLFPSIAASFPEIVADFVLLWSVGDSQFDFDESDGRQHTYWGDGPTEVWSNLGNAITSGLERVAFENVGLDLGSFLTDVLAPIVEEVQKVTKPIQPIIEILTTPIPVISDLAGPTTLLDLAAAFAKGRFDVGLIKAVADIVTLVNAIPIPEEGEDLIINFGDFVIVGAGAGGGTIGLDLTNPSTASGLKDLQKPQGNDFDRALASKPASASKSFTQKLKSGGFGDGFSFPILTDPAQVFGLLMGNEATLIEYDMPALVFNFSYTQFFPIFGPLGVSITGEVGATIDFAFGYDTAGIQQFIDTGAKNPLLLFNGFFVSDLDDSGRDVAELQLDAGITAAAELNLGVARAGVAGGIFAEVDFNLHDPNDDGKLRIYELVTNVLNQAKYGGDLAFLAPLAIFDVSGEVFARLFAFLKIDLFFFSLSKQFNITPPITIVDFEIPFTRVPTLATVIDGGVLQLNVGEFAGERLEGDVTDGNEQIKVRQGSAANKFLVWSEALGVDFGDAQEYTASSRILAKGGAGNDLIDLSLVTADIDFEIEGGVGNDVIKLGATSLGSGIVRGGAGDDELWGSAGANVIYGEQGNDTIHAGGGSDIVFGDSGEVLGQSMTVTFSSKDGNDTIHGEGGDDFLFGGGGNDTITGGDNHDIILGDGGRVYLDTVPNPDVWVVEDSNKATGGGVDMLSGGAGNDRIYGGKGNDTLNGEAGEDQLFGEDGVDTIHGGPENDLIRGGIGDDIIHAGSGNDQVYGEDGIDLIHGDAGDDLLRGGRGADTIWGDDGEDDIFGDGEPDTIFGGAGIDEIDGGTGADSIKGGDDDDLIIIRSASDTADGEGGGDSYIVTFKGGNASSLIKLLDTGSVTDIDVFVAHGTVFDDEILLRSNTTGSIAFVALINSPTAVERVNYSFMERVIVNGSFGNDYFASDDTAAEVTLNGEADEDTFQIGQMFKSDRGDITDLNSDQFSDVTGVALEDVFATIETTRGFLSNGISAPMTINGGLGADRFVVYHNRAVLQLNGEEGDDVFEVRAFALSGSQEPQRERTDITGGAGADLVQYAVNAPVNINGGDGFDTLVVIGTEFGDDLVITDKGVFGAGLNINFVNIESLRVDGAEGDDRFFVKSTSEKFITELFGGLGSDTFNMSGDTPPVVSNDLRGHSGLVVHGVESVDPRFDEQKIFGISANVADNDEPFAVIRQTDGSTIITEGDAVGDSYEIVLTRAPEPGKPVFVKVLAPIPTPTDRERRGQSFRVDSATKVDSSLDGSAITLRFDHANWMTPQVVKVVADSAPLRDLAGLFTRPEIQGEDTDVPSGIPFDMDDNAFEGARSGVINHLIQSSSGSHSGTLQAVSALAGTVLIPADTTAPLIPLDELLGRTLFISEGPGIGQTRFIVNAVLEGSNWRLTLDRAFSGAEVPLASFSKFFISIDDAYTGRMTSFTEGAFVGGDPNDDQRSIFVDTAGGFPTTGQGLTGAILEIVGGPGAGQQRLILGHVDGAEATSLILSGPWSADPVPGQSVYRIERYDGLAIPSVSVHIHDNDTPGVIVDETKAWKDGALVDDFDTITSAIEGGDGDHRGEIDVLRVKLNTNPGAAGGTVSLVYDATQLEVTDTAGNLVSSVSFTGGDWSSFKNLLVKAADDTIREGFHSSLIEFVVTAGSVDGTASQTDRFVDVPDDEPVFLVGLSQLPKAGTTVSVTIDGVPLAADEFTVENSQVLFLEDGQPTGRAGTIIVSYQYVVPGFQSALTAPVLVKLHDDDAPTVIVRETGGTTDVVELAASGSASQTIFGTALFPNVLTFNFGSAIPTSGGGILTVSAIADLDWSFEFLTLQAEDQFTTSLFVNGGLQYGLVTTTINLTADQLEAMAAAGGITFTVTPSFAVNDLSFLYGIQERVSLRLDTFSAPDDSYELVLSGRPDDGNPLTLNDSVKVKVTPEITKTTRTGGIRHDAVQVALSNSSGDLRVQAELTDDGTPTGNLFVTFDSTNWDVPVVIDVAAIDDQVVDGSDTQVFAPGPNTVSGILGPVFVEGAGGRGSLAMNAPLLLPGETNQRETDGNVVAFEQDTVGNFGALELMTVETEDLLAKMTGFGFTLFEQLHGLTIEMSQGPGTDVVLDPERPNEKFDRFWLIQEVQSVAGDPDHKVLRLQNPSQVQASALGAGDVPNASSDYAITRLSVNFFVDERTQVDFMFVHDEDSPADSSGVLTPTRLSGLNMGPDLVIGGERRPGGITYNDLEVLEINLGKGNNTFTVLGTHTRADGFQTWTFLNTGDETVPYASGPDPDELIMGDTVTVKLHAQDVTTDTGIVAAAENPNLGNGLRTTITIVTAFANDALAGQVITVLDQETETTQQRRILGNVGNFLTVDRTWEDLPAGFTYTIVNPADGAFAVNAQRGNDTVDATGSTLGIVAFGGLGNDRITGGSGDDILFGDRGRVDYFNGQGAIVTRLGDAPEPILGFVTRQVAEDPGPGEDPLNLITDSGASFPLADDEVGDGLGADDIGLRGLFVDINNGKGFLQTPRLITENTATTLTIFPGFSPLEELPGPFLSGEDIPSEYRISTVPEDQTDGVVRTPELYITVDNHLGGSDTIHAGEGKNELFGGAGSDTLTGGADEDVIIGDGGRVDRRPDGTLSRAVTVQPGSGGGDVIDAGEGFDVVLGGDGGDDIDAGVGDFRDVVVGDSGIAVFDAEEVLTFISSIVPSQGGSDEIIVGQGEDFVVGGSGGDFINYNREDGTPINSADTDRDFIIGDNGFARFDNDDGRSLLRHIETSDFAFFGNDLIQADDGSDVVLGGGGDDDIDAGTDGSRDIVIGDNGKVVLDALERIETIETTQPTNGGSDFIVVGEGDDVVFGGVGNDFINVRRDGVTLVGADSGRDIIVGDNGIAIFRAGTTRLHIIKTTDDHLTDPQDDLLVFHYDDTIFAGNGPDVVLGGNGDDYIDAGTDVDGETDFSRDIVIGDNGRAEYDVNEVLINIRTTEQDLGGDDDIVVGDGDDVVMGGIGSDYINWVRGGERIADDTGKDVVIGDNGEAWFNAVAGESQIREITTTDHEHGGDDHIFAAEGQDVVFGGSGADVIDAGTDPNDLNPDIVIGDNGRATFNGNQAPSAEEAGSVLSFNFNGENKDAIVTGVAGKVAAGNWNNLKDEGPRVYGNDAGELLYFDDGKIAPGITIEWGADLDSTHKGDPDDLHEESHSQIHINSSSSQDQRLFEGYLSADTKEKVGVNIAGLNAHFSSYAVYVYLDLDDHDSRSGSSVRSITVRTDTGEQTQFLDDPDGHTFSGDYEGFYVKFEGLNGDVVDIRIDDVGSSSSNKPGITAVQVAGTHHPIDRIETIATTYGGIDVISTGSGPDIVFGGEKGDDINTYGNSIYGEFDADIVAGDNASATFMVLPVPPAPLAAATPLFVLGELREIHTTDFEAAGTDGEQDGDEIHTGNGEDVVIGGNGGDFIDSGTPADSYDYGALKVVSINFNSDVAEGKITGVAGAVAVDGWHNVTGGKGSASVEGIQVQWGEEKSSWWYGTSLSSTADRDSHDGIDPDTQNERLFEGYLEEDDRRLGVDLSGLSGPYDVYVYLDSDEAHGHDDDDDDDHGHSHDPAVVKVSAGGQAYYVNDPGGNTFDGTFVDASSGTALAPVTGNFVVFRGLTAGDLSIRLEGDETLGRHADGRPSIAAIQIVSGDDRQNVVITGDVDSDRVVGDNAVVRWFEGQVYEIVTTNLQTSGSLSDYQGDTITLGNGADIAIGGNGGDDLAGGEGDDLLLGDNARLLLFKGEVIDLGHHDHGHDDDDDDDDDHHHHHGDWNPYDVFGIELLGEAIGGNDILEGGKDDDLIYGQFGNDSYLFAGGGLGQDLLVEAGHDHHHGHDDDDHHHHHHHDHGLNDLHDMLDFSRFIGGIDVNLDQSGQQTINGYRTDGDVNLKLVLFHGDAFEDVIGSEYADCIDGNERDNVLVGLGGNDDIEGDSGDDVLLGNAGDDTLEGGWGNDILDGGEGHDRLEGGHGDHDDDDDHGDYWKKSHGSDILLGGAGNDRLKGGSGNDLLDGGMGNDRLEGDSGDDILLGGDGDDELDGDSGKDLLVGGAGKDDLDGGSDADTIYRDATDKVKSDKKDTVITASALPDLSAFFVSFNDKFRSEDSTGAGPSVDWQPGIVNGWGNRFSPFAGASTRTGGNVSDVLFKLSWSASPQGEGARYDELGAALSKTRAAR